ncbi:fumarylacetoacetate hydrolase family protein [Shewanella salipaludis]|nr:fumarylacetoacetate hydrolase family protein [Shewanella salipaludis]
MMQQTNPLAGIDEGLKSVTLGERRLVPSKIVCIGRNYVDHIHELGNEVPEQMVIFIKPNSAITQQLSAFSGEALHYETELCLLYWQGRFIAAAVGLDLTKRELQGRLKAKGLPWERAKAFDGSALFSPFVSLEPHGELNFSLHLDEQLLQLGNLELMIHKPDEILAEIQSFMSLNDGDIVMTGTPKGVGVVQAGSRFRVTLCDAEQVLLEWQWQAI